MQSLGELLDRVGTHFILLIFISLFLGVTGCDSRFAVVEGEESVDSVDRSDTVTELELLTEQALGILTLSCASCHNEQVKSGGVGTLTSFQALVDGGLLIPGDAAGSLLYQTISENRMPMGAPLDPSSKKIIADWINAADGTSPSPGSNGSQPEKTLTTAQALARIRQDLQLLPEVDRRYMRYLTFTHIYMSSEIPAVQKPLFIKGAIKALNSVHYRSSMYKPVILDPEDQTILRIDIRQLDISLLEWAAIAGGDAYPYFRQLSGRGDFGFIQSLSGTSLAVVRGDWFIQRILQPQIYAQLMALPENVKDLETELGVDAQRNILEQKVVRAGVADSGVSFSNRVIERHQSRFGAYWKSYDFSGYVGVRNIFDYPLGPLLEAGSSDLAFRHDGGEMIFTLPNGLHGYVLTDGEGNLIPQGPTEIVADPTRSDKVVTNSISCFTCHTSGIIPTNDEVRNQSLGRSRGFAPSSLEVIKKLYPESSILAATFQQDISAYVQALNKIGIQEGVEPVSTATLHYASDISLSGVAAELDLPAGELAERINRKSELRELLGDLTDGASGVSGKIPRAEFEQKFREILEAL